MWGWVVMFVLDFSCIWLSQIKVRFVTIIQVVYIVILILGFCCSLSGLVGSSERIRAVQVQM